MHNRGGQAKGSVLCVDIGGTSTRIGMMRADGGIEILDSIPSRGPAESLADSICETLRRHKSEATLGVGIAVAGFLNDDRDRMIYNSNLAWLESYPLRDHIQRQVNTRVELEVDSNAAAIAEGRFGAGRGAARFLCITVGTGLGVGMIVNGKPLRFAYGCMGDAGHVIVERDGPLCSCGGRGCAEVLVSAPVLAEQFRVQSGKESQTSLRDVIEAARNGDSISLAILDRAGEWLGIATASFANTFLPDRIAFAGGFAEAGDLVMNGIKRTFNYSASQFARDQVTLCRATFGAQATILGAAYSILD